MKEKYENDGTFLCNDKMTNIYMSKKQNGSLNNKK